MDERRILRREKKLKGGGNRQQIDRRGVRGNGELMAFRGKGFWAASLPMFHQQNKKGGGK
jgi:hypothetical protein